MQVLVIGDSAREEAIIWKLKQSPNVTGIICAPGNKSIKKHVETMDIMPNDVEKLADLAVVQHIDLTIASSEESIAAGVVDCFRKRRLRIFGPTKEAAQIATSRHFGKELFLKHKIPTARYAIFDNETLAKPYIASRKLPIVLKPEALSKTPAFIIHSHQEANVALHELFSRDSKISVLIEDYIDGTQFSLEIVCDGTQAVAMLPVCNQRSLKEGNEGPNTQGMGAYAPFADISEDALSNVVSKIADPLIKILAEAGTPYQGMLHLSVAIDKDNTPRLLALHSSFAELETQVLLPLLEEDLFEIFWATTEGDLAHFHQSGFRFSSDSALAVAFVKQDYDQEENEGLSISGIEELHVNEVVCIKRHVLDNAAPVTVAAKPIIFYGDDSHPHNHILSLVVVAENLLDAKVAAYELAKKIQFENMYYRKDIGDNALG